jgi:PAS domain S-box-containing protein
MDTFVLGLLLILGGFAVTMLTLVVARLVSRPHKQVPSPVPEAISPQHVESSDGILLVQTGGNVLYANQPARDWFGYQEEQLNLERLTRRTRPAEAFLALCASQGQQRFSLNGRLVDGSSYYVPYFERSNGAHAALQGGAMLVAMRPIQMAVASEEGGVASEQAVNIFAELNQAMAASLDLETAIQSILESVERLIPADHFEVTIWDTAQNKLIPYRFIGLPGVDRCLEKSSIFYSADEGYSGYLVTQRKPLLVENVDTFQTVRVSQDHKQVPFRSFVGVDLEVAGELIGTLELSAVNIERFTTNDLELLKILSGQAAITLKNALLFQEEQKRVQELSGLANLAQAVEGFLDVEELYQRLIDSLAAMLPVKSLGFLIFDENLHRLEAQKPFIGIPDPMIELFKVSVPAGSETEELWLSDEILLAANAQTDPHFISMGMDYMAKAAGIQNTILVPLTAAGRQMGYLQAADKQDGTPFDQDDVRLMTIIAGQVAAILVNAALVRESHERAQRSEALRRVASLTGSVATLDEILSFSLREVARLLRADLAVTYMLDDTVGELRLHKESVFGFTPASNARYLRMNMTDLNFKMTVTASQRALLSSNLGEDQDAGRLYRVLAEDLQLQSLVAVPLLNRNQGVGELILGSKRPSSFDRNDTILLTTTAGQLASAIEKSVLLSQTDESLQRRVMQLLALMRVSRELNATLDLQHLIRLVYNEALQATNADCGSIILFETSSSPVYDIRLSVGDTNVEQMTALEEKVASNGEAVIIKDYESTDQSQLAPHLNVRSSLILPIIFEDKIAGLLHLHAWEAEKFDDTALEIAQSLAIQAAIALGNAQRYQEQMNRTEMLNRRIEAMNSLLETTRYLKTDQPLEQSLETIAFGIQDATPFNTILISIYDLPSGNLVWSASAGVPLDKFSELKRQPQAWVIVDEILQPTYRFSNSYLIPYDQAALLPPEFHRVSFMTSDEYGAPNLNSWHAQDMLLIPLLQEDGQPLGMISVDEPRDGLRPDLPSIETLEIFASQASMVIESHQQRKNLMGEVDALEKEYQTVSRALAGVQNSVPVLLHKDLANTLAIQRLNQRTRWTRASLDITELMNRQETRDDVLRVVGQELLTRMGMETVLIAEPGEGGPRIIFSLGALPSGVAPQSLLGQRNPLRTSLQSGKGIFVSSLDEDKEWKNSPLLAAFDAKAFICLPVIAGTPRSKTTSASVDVNAVILALNNAPMPALDADDQHIFAVLGRQLADALENLRMLDETNRRLQEVNLLLEFSRQLGTLDTASILHTLVESTLEFVSAPEAGMVALWVPEQEMLIPQFAAGYLDNPKMLQITYKSGESLPGKVFAEGQMQCIDEVDFAHHYSLSSEQILLYRDATGGRLPVSSLVVPIQTFDAHLGVLVLDNFKTSGAFSASDQALVASLARQTALTLENAHLYQASSHRAAQLQALTNVASAITSSLQVNELISTILDQAKVIIPYDTGTLWLRLGDQMTVRDARGFADSEERVGLSVALADSLLLQEMIQTSQPISVSDVRSDVRFPAFLEHQYLSWLGIPLLSKGEVVGVIALEKVEPNFYTPANIQVMATFASQAAVALENARLYEDSVRRAVELDERSQRLSLLNRLSTALSGLLDITNISAVTCQELNQAVHSSVVSVLVFDSSGIPILQAETPQRTVNIPGTLSTCGMFERLRESLGVFYTENIPNEGGIAPLAAYFTALESLTLLAVPLAVGPELLGLAMIHNNTAYRHSPDEIELARTICNQAAVALQNARLFGETERLIGETQQRSTELSTLFNLGVSLTQVLDLRRLLDVTFENVANLIQADAILLVLTDEEDNLVAHILEKGKRLEPQSVTRSGSSFSELVLKTNSPLLISDTQSNKQPVSGVHLGDPCRCWLGAPLMVRGITKGVLSVQSYTPEVFGEGQLRLLSQIANQLSVALDNAELFAQVQNYASDLEKRVSDRTDQLGREHKRTQTLLSIITELSTSLDLDIVLNRTLAVINETIEAEHSLILLLQPDGRTLYLRASLGYVASLPKGGQPSSLKSDQGLAGWVINNRQAVLVQDLWEDARWIQRDNKSESHRSALAVPLMVGEDNLGSLMLFHRQPGFFSEDQLDLIQGTAKQIAVAINNAQLYNLIRDQAERLGDMLRTQHIETSRSQAILEAVADGVLVTDARRQITLFNASAEQILGLNRSDILGQSLEHFTGLFGRAAQSWVQTIRTWSEDPDSYQPGDTYAEQITTDNRHVVAVHLSPVRLRDDFLGTVSIFRDITHQVEVDRLKSEFVATVSHELRTPMTSIKGYVEILLMGAGGLLTDQQVHFLQIVKTNTERLAVLVNDLLDVSRIEAGKVDLSLQALDMEPIVDVVIHMLEERMKDEERPMTFSKDIPTDLPLVLGDPERVRQIIDNLLENAYQYTPSEGKVVVKIRAVNGEVQVDVRDNGIGIQPEERNRIFERFYRGEDPLVLATSGTGLGLPIVQTLVEMHKGRIWFESSGVSGEGSTFSFTLPLYKSGEISQEDEDDAEYILS